MDLDLDLCNKALSHLAVGVEIASPAESTKEAKTCRRFWDDVVTTFFRDYAWNFSTRIASLALVTDMTADATAEWAFSYRYPADCTRFHRIVSGALHGNDTRQSRVPYRVVSDGAGRLIYTDMEDAIAEYSIIETQPARWTSDTRLAFSLYLASYIAPRLTGGDQFKLGERAYKLYRAELEKARANDATETQPDEEPDSSFERTRL